MRLFTEESLLRDSRTLESEQQFNPPFEALVDYFNGGDQLERFIERFTAREGVLTPTGSSCLSDTGC